MHTTTPSTASSGTEPRSTRRRNPEDRHFPDATSVAATCPTCGLIGFVDLDKEAKLLRGDRRFRRVSRPEVTATNGHVTEPAWVTVLHNRCGQRVRFIR